MSTSGTATYNPDVIYIVTEAFAQIRIGTEGEPLTAEMMNEAFRSFNMMVKAWDAEGLHLWCKTEGVLFLVGGQAQYLVGGSGGTANSCLYDDLVVTYLTADAVSGASSITVNSISGIASGDNIAVLLNSGALQWTTVNGAPSGNTVTLTAPLSDDVTANGAVFAYTTKLERPTRIIDARRRIFNTVPSSWQDIPLTLLERPDYYMQPTKFNPATETMLYYDPQLGTGRINLWSAPSVVTDLCLFTFERPIQDITTVAQTVDFPQEWLETLAWNLAFRLAPKYSFPIAERAQLGAIADNMRQKLLGFDKEYASVTFTPDFTAGGGFGPPGGW